MKREIFPCYFGSALKLEGIDELLAGLSEFTESRKARKDFGARVFKISRDEAGVRLTFVKITGGSVRIRDSINGEKVNSVRVYSGMKYEIKDEAFFYFTKVCCLCVVYVPLLAGYFSGLVSQCHVQILLLIGTQFDPNGLDHEKVRYFIVFN